MRQVQSAAATVGFVVPARVLPTEVAPLPIALTAPPELARSVRSGLVLRVLPAGLAVLTGFLTLLAFRSGAVTAHNPGYFALPIMMLASAVVTAASGRDRRGAAEIDADRVEYLGYLARLAQSVTETAVAQRGAATWCHPQPDALWTLIGGQRMWERRFGDADFCCVRIGVGTQPLASRVIVPELGPVERRDPITVAALGRFLETYLTVPDVPIAITLRGLNVVTAQGDPDGVRGLLRAAICQLAVLHAPDRLRIAAAVGALTAPHWDWLKWLPHHQLAEAPLPGAGAHLVLVVDGGSGGALAGVAGLGVTVLQVGSWGDPGGTGATVQLRLDGPMLTVQRAGADDEFLHADYLELIAALVCARRLAGYHVGEPRGPQLSGPVDIGTVDPVTFWRNRNHAIRLRVPIGVTSSGALLELDIKEAAENGMGPHGLCIGATGSGKSELLRTVAVGMMALNSPEVLNLILVDFKGGATFLGLERAPHVAAVITNLAQEAHLVDRMRDALTGEMTRRQQLLRAAGNVVSVAAYQVARSSGADLPALPALCIIVDEFTELLSQQPDFADIFVAIGRLGRSLGMHLLLASQRLDEGRLRGLEAHLSYRICLKTLSANESRIVLGTSDAYELPNTPGAGYLRSGPGDLSRFQAASVSVPLQASADAVRDARAAPAVELFTAQPSVAVTNAGTGGAGPTVMQRVLDRLSGLGPPAHEVWLPPLGAAPALDTVLAGSVLASGGLRVAIGIVDRPLEQCRLPLLVDLSGGGGHVAVVGGPQAGKSTALRTLIMALAAIHDPRQVQFYCVDFGGGALAAMRSLPQVGEVVTRGQPELVARLLDKLQAIVRSREGWFRDHRIDSMDQYRQLRAERQAAVDTDRFGDVFLVVDGWASFRREFDALEESVTSLAMQGLSFGIHLVLTASRWAEIRATLKDQIGTRIELRLGDPADSEVDRKRAHHVPRDRPGRGLSPDGLHMVIATPRLDGMPSNAELGDAALRVGASMRQRYGDEAAPSIPILPSQVDQDAVVAQARGRLATRILLGLEERELNPVAIDFESRPHLLILGERRCGKTAALRTVCREIFRTKPATQAELFIVDLRRELLGVVQSEHLGGYCAAPLAVEGLLAQLLSRLGQRRAGSADGQDFYLVIDDYDRVAAAAGNLLAPLLEYLPHAGDLGLHLVVARRNGGAVRALYEPLLAGLRDLGCTGLVMSGQPDDGPLLGVNRPVSLPPGRGILVTGDGPDGLVQVGWSAPA